jgi:hypothetical protein
VASRVGLGEPPEIRSNYLQYTQHRKNYRSQNQDPVLYDVYLVFREKKLLELLSETQNQGSSLIIYGAGHYYNIAPKLRASGYSSNVVRKLTAFPIMQVDINEFLEALRLLIVIDH